MPVTIARSATFFERVRFRVDGAAVRLDARRSTTTSVVRLDRERGTTSASTCPGHARRAPITSSVSGTNWGRTADARPSRSRSATDLPTAKAPSHVRRPSEHLGRLDQRATLTLASAGRRPPTRPTAIAGYEVAAQHERRRLGARRPRPRASTRVARGLGLRDDVSVPGPGAGRRRATGAHGSRHPARTSRATVSDRSSLVDLRRHVATVRDRAAADGGITTPRQAGRRRSTTRSPAGRSRSSRRRADPRPGDASTSTACTGTTIDLRTSSDACTARSCTSATGRTAGTHTIELRVAGTSGRPTVSLDGFVVLARSALAAPRRRVRSRLAASVACPRALS